MMFKLEDVRFDDNGLVPAIVQDAATGEVLTLAYMTAESLRLTLEQGETWFWSRSRGQLWHKGETSGNTQRVVDVRLDCDADALVVRVEPSGPACHTGAISCFHQAREVAQGDGAKADAVTESSRDGLGVVLEQLYAVVEDRRREMPDDSYTTYLFEKGLDKILKKVGEESAETIIAAKNGDAEALTAEVADLLYHLIVMLVERGLKLEAVSEELARRAGKRGRE